MAAQLVARVLEERVPADDLLPAAGVTARDQPLLAALVFGALRWHYRLEWQAKRLLTRPLARDQGALGALLRIGLLQLQELRIPEHAAVSATVDATVVLGLRSARGLVNAVLRRFQREREQLAQAALQADEARFAHPPWLVDAIRADYPHDWQAVLAANNAPPPMWLRVNLLRTTRAAYLDKLAGGRAGRGRRTGRRVRRVPRRADRRGRAAGVRDGRGVGAGPVGAACRVDCSSSTPGSACSTRARHPAARPVTSSRRCAGAARSGPSIATPRGSTACATTSSVSAWRRSS